MARKPDTRKLTAVVFLVISLALVILTGYFGYSACTDAELHQDIAVGGIVVLAVTFVLLSVKLVFSRHVPLILLGVLLFAATTTCLVLFWLDADSVFLEQFRHWQSFAGTAIITGLMLVAAVAVAVQGINLLKE